MPFALQKVLNSSKSIGHVSEESPDRQHPKQSGNDIINEYNHVVNLPYDAVYEINDDSETSLDTNQSNSSVQLANQIDGENSGHDSDKAHGNKTTSSNHLAMKGNRVVHLPKRIFDSRDFMELDVSSPISDLFQFVDEYQPVDVKIETSLKCFIPNYIPAINPIDNFAKPTPPDNRESKLGKTVLDEPAAVQSDPVEIQLRLRTTQKLRNDFLVVKRVEDSANNAQEIESWIKTIGGLNRSKPSSIFRRRTPGPNVESLMQPLSKPMEDLILAFQDDEFINSEIDLSLEDYVKIICALLGIPVRDDSIIESLYILMQLFDEFQRNQHFNK